LSVLGLRKCAPFQCSVSAFLTLREQFPRPHCGQSPLRERGDSSKIYEKQIDYDVEHVCVLKHCSSSLKAGVLVAGRLLTYVSLPQRIPNHLENAAQLYPQSKTLIEFARRMFIEAEAGSSVCS